MKIDRKPTKRNTSDRDFFLVHKMVKSYEDIKSLESIPLYLGGLSSNKNNQLALIASSLTSRNWNGFVCVFNEAKFAPNIPHIDFGISTEAGCTSVKWVNEQRLVVSTDAGSVEILDLRDSEQTLENTLSLSEHSDICSSVDVSQHTQQLITGSWDHYIKLWDLEVDLSIHSILIHSDKVFDVKWSDFSGNIFSSASEDRTVKVYDNRTEEKPAFSLVQTEAKDHPTCLEWMDENTIVFGTKDGHISCCDIRKPFSVVCTVQSHKGSVNTLLQVKDSQLYSASTDCTVKCFDAKLQEIYCSSQHKDYVTGLNYDEKENVVWSCAWDGKIFSHTLDMQPNEMES